MTFKEKMYNIGNYVIGIEDLRPEISDDVKTTNYIIKYQQFLQQFDLKERKRIDEEMNELIVEIDEGGGDDEVYRLHQKLDELMAGYFNSLNESDMMFEMNQRLVNITNKLVKAKKDLDDTEQRELNGRKKLNDALIQLKSKNEENLDLKEKLDSTKETLKIKSEELTKKNINIANKETTEVELRENSEALIRENADLLSRISVLEAENKEIKKNLEMERSLRKQISAKYE